MNVKLGYAPYDIYRGTPQSPLGNLTADGFIWMAKQFHGIDADVAVYNSGGVRSNISEGEVTLGDVYAVYPFDNTLGIISLKGSALTELLSDVVSGGLHINKEVNIVASGSTVTSITVNGEAIDPDKVYKVVSADYLLDNDRYASIFNQKLDREDSVEMIRDYFGEYFKYLASQNGGEIIAGYDDRIIVLE